MADRCSSFGWCCLLVGKWKKLLTFSRSPTEPLCAHEKFHAPIEVLNTDTKTLQSSNTQTHTNSPMCAHAHKHIQTGWPSSLREGGYPFFHCCLPVSGRRLPWKQGLTGNNRRERKKSGALPTSPPLLLCVPCSKYPLSQHTMHFELITGFP